MKNKNGLTRRRFITNSAIAGIGTIGSVNLLASCAVKNTEPYNDIKSDKHEYNGYYSGKNLDRIAFPVGGMGAGMFCLEGTGAI